MNAPSLVLFYRSIFTHEIGAHFLIGVGYKHALAGFDDVHRHAKEWNEELERLDCIQTTLEELAAFTEFLCEGKALRIIYRSFKHLIRREGCAVLLILPERRAEDAMTLVGGIAIGAGMKVGREGQVAKERRHRSDTTFGRSTDRMSCGAISEGVSELVDQGALRSSTRCNFRG